MREGIDLIERSGCTKQDPIEFLHIISIECNILLTSWIPLGDI